MRTTLSPETLARIHTEGRATAGRFVNPTTIERCRRLLTERGEEWAASVLLRSLDRRSPINKALPWLYAGEEEMLVLADAAEFAQLTKDVTDA